MSRISIEARFEEHPKLKTMAALRDQSIKDYVIERTLGGDEGPCEEAALHELEALLDDRIRTAKISFVGRRTVREIFSRAYREANGN